MPNAKTAGNEQETDSYAAVDLRVIADQIDALRDLILERADELEKKVDHVDGLAHEVSQRVAAISADLEKYKPLLEKYSALQSMFKPKGPRRG